MRTEPNRPGDIRSAMSYHEYRAPLVNHSYIKIRDNKISTHSLPNGDNIHRISREETLQINNTQNFTRSLRVHFLFYKMYVAYQLKIEKTKSADNPTLSEWKMEKKRVKKIDEFIKELDDLVALRKRFAQRIQVTSDKKGWRKRPKKRRGNKEEKHKYGPLAREKRRYAETEKLITQMQSIIYRNLARQ